MRYETSELPFYVEVKAGNRKKIFCVKNEKGVCLITNSAKKQVAQEAHQEIKRLFENGSQTLIIKCYGKTVSLDNQPLEQGSGWFNLKDKNPEEFFICLKIIGKKENAQAKEVKQKRYITQGEAERHTRWTATVDRRKGLDL